jgi:hypothetical protein
MAELKKVTREREQVHLLRVCTYHYYRAGNRVARSFSTLARQVDIVRATYVPRLSVAAAIRHAPCAR